MNRRRNPLYQRGGKRAFDLSMGLAAGLISLPIQAAVALLVSRKLGRPVLFRQVRPGRFGTPFEIMKFRTMTDERDATGTLLPDAERLTSFGAFLRSTSLDELPELLNVIKGEMSIVGPRPLLMKYLDRYSEFENRRHEVRPGITGLAQVSGRNGITWDQKFELDVWYSENMSLRLDLSILFRTLVGVATRRGINQHGHATATEFVGSPRERSGLQEHD